MKSTFLIILALIASIILGLGLNYLIFGEKDLGILSALIPFILIILIFAGLFGLIMQWEHNSDKKKSITQSSNRGTLKTEGALQTSDKLSPTEEIIEEYKFHLNALFTDLRNKVHFEISDLDRAIVIKSQVNTDSPSWMMFLGTILFNEDNLMKCQNIGIERYIFKSNDSMPDVNDIDDILNHMYQQKNEDNS